MTLMGCLFLLSEKPSLYGSCDTECAGTQKHERGRLRYGRTWLESDIFGGNSGIATFGGYKTGLDGSFIRFSKEIAR